MAPRILWIGLLSLTAPLALFAQGPPPRQISGVVSDQTGAAIVGAEVVLNSGSSSATVTTDDRGGFAFAQVPADSGEVKVSAAGFQTRTVAWAADADLLQIVLLPASAAEQVTVTANRTGVRVIESATSVTILSAQDLTDYCRVPD